MARVYNSEARTSDVYLNGELDNGFLLGSVTAAQHSSRSPIYVARRSDLTGFEFAGFIRDLRIYSKALNSAEIASQMRGHVTGPPALDLGEEDNMDSRQTHRRHDLVHALCAISSDREDRFVPIAAAGIGLLAAVAGVGLWPNSGGCLWLVVSLAAGGLLPLTTLPPINFLLVPMTSFAGGASVVASIRRAT